MSNIKMSKDVKKSKNMSKMSRNCKLYFICHEMSNVKKSNTLTMVEVHKKLNLTQ